MANLTAKIKELVKLENYKLYSDSKGEMSEEQKRCFNESLIEILNNVHNPQFDNKESWVRYLPEWTYVIWDELEEGLKIMLYLVAEECHQLNNRIKGDYWPLA